MKQCSKCNKVLSLNNFHNDSCKKDGKYSICKQCRIEKGKKFYMLHKDTTIKNYFTRNKHKIKTKKKVYDKQYREIHREAILLRNKQWYQDNKQKKYNYDILYRKKNKNKNNARLFWRKQNDIQFRIGCNLRQRLSVAVRNNSKSGSAVKDLGCTIQELKQYLEGKFQSGMTWGNYGLYGWHIDHIVPVSSFDLTNKKQFLKACHYTNLQPLWAKDNLMKKNKTEY